MNIPHEPNKLFFTILCLAALSGFVGLLRWLLGKEDDRDMVVALVVVAFAVGLLLLYVYL